MGTKIGLLAGAALVLHAGVSFGALVNIGTVMPLGDSITYGDAWTGGIGGSGVRTPIAGGYRSEFYTALHNAGVSFQFVGSQNDNADPTLTAAGQTAHEGHNGYFTQTLDAGLMGIVPNSFGDGNYFNGSSSHPATNPDIITLLAGSNNIFNGTGGANLGTVGLDNLIGDIFADRPSAHVYISDLIPMTANNHNDQVIIANSYIPAEVTKYKNLGMNITEVFSYNTFLNGDGSINNSLLFDGLHPSAAGYKVLGDDFANAVMASATNTASIPEPSTLALDVVVLPMLLARRRKYTFSRSFPHHRKQDIHRMAGGNPRTDPPLSLPPAFLFLRSHP